MTSSRREKAPCNAPGPASALRGAPETTVGLFGCSRPAQASPGGKRKYTALRRHYFWFSEKIVISCSYFVLYIRARPIIFVASRSGRGCVAIVFDTWQRGAVAATMPAPSRAKGPGWRFAASGETTAQRADGPSACPDDSSFERGDVGASSHPWDMEQAAKSIRVRSAGVKATVHRCDSLLMRVLLSAHRAAGSHNAQAFRTPFRA